MGGRAPGRGGQRQGNDGGGRAAGRDGAAIVVPGQANAARGRGRGGHARNGDGGAAEDGALVAGLFGGVGRGGRGRGRGRGRGIIEVPQAAPPIAVLLPPLPPPAGHQQPHDVFPFFLPKCPLCNHAILPVPTGLNIASSLEMLRFGLGLMGWEIMDYGATNLTRFRAHYGIDPDGVFVMFQDLKERRGEADPFSLLMAMNFLKCYQTEPCMASRWRLQEATIRIKVREYVRHIQELKETKVNGMIW